MIESASNADLQKCNYQMGGQLEALRRDNRVEFDRNFESSEQELDRDFLIEVFSPVWEISWRNYTNSHWKAVLPRIVSCSTGNITLKNINAPDILKQFIQIRFDCLRHLYLDNLMLAGVEPLIHLRAPSLETLLLGESCLLNFKSLRKMNAPNLKKLQFKHTAIVEADLLSECRFSPQMSSIIVFNTTTKTLPENYIWLFKIEPKGITYFQLYNTQIIRTEPLKRMVKQKYPGCQTRLRFDTLDL